MAGSAVVGGIASHGLARLGLAVDGAVGVDSLGAVVLVVVVALLAVTAGVCLSTDTDAVTDLDVLDVASNLDGLADDFVTDAAC